MIRSRESLLIKRSRESLYHDALALICSSSDAPPGFPHKIRLRAARVSFLQPQQLFAKKQLELLLLLLNVDAGSLHLDRSPGMCVPLTLAITTYIYDIYTYIYIYIYDFSEILRSVLSGSRRLASSVGC